MRITDLQVDGFGVWNGLTVEGVESRMTVFYGPNEAGKTTLLQFVRAVLYGFATDRKNKYLPPVYGGTGGGSIYVETNAGDFQIQRLEVKSPARNRIGDLAVTSSSDGSVAGQDALDRLLGNVDESVFSNVFAIGLRELQELATLNDTDAARELYKLASGLDRVSLIDVMRQLRDERTAVEGTNKSPGRVQSLTTTLKELEREIEKARSGSRRWVKLGAELAELDEQLVRLGEEIEIRESEAKRVEVAMQIAPHCQERTLLDKRVESLGTLPDQSELSLEQLDRVNQKIHQLDAKIEDADQRMTSVKSEGKALPMDPALVDSSCRIEALAEHAPWLDSLEGQIVRLKSEMTHLHDEMGLSENGRDAAAMVDAERHVTEISAKTLSALKTPARSLRRAEQKRETALRAKEEADLKRTATHDEFEALLLELHCNDLDQALEDVGHHVNQLKRVKQIDERLGRLDLQRRQMEEEIDEANEEQIMPIGRTLLVGLFVVLGIGMAIFGFAGFAIQSMTPNPIMGMGGVAFALIGWVIKLYGDARAQRRLDRCQRQYELLLGQIQRARSERDELDRDGGQDTRVIDERLAEAEDDLLRLEELLPFRHELDNCREECRQAEEACEQAHQQTHAMHARWQAALRGLHLPDSLTPARVKALSAQSARVSESRHRLNACRKELAEREEELSRLGDRVRRTATEVGIAAESYQPLELIELMTETLQEQRHLRDRRSDLIKQYKEQRKSLKSLRRQRKRLDGFRERMLSGVGARDEKQYREIAIRLEQRTDLLERIKGVEQQVQTTLSKHQERDTITALVDQFGEGGLEPHWEQLQAQVERLEKQRDEKHELRGQRLHEMKTLGDDRTADELELQAETIRREIRRDVANWKVTAITNSILDSLRRRYEEERQPETLNEASRYLKSITRGKYVRIWTRLEGDALFVDMADGETLRVDVLSQGTREAIFLSLRLALASAYARRGIRFPLVLDDLLVNYDAERTRAAAQVLLDYANQGRQVIFFTCHDHIRDLFHELSADVRVLPAQRDVIDHHATAIRYVGPRVMNEVEEEYEEVDEEEPDYDAEAELEEQVIEEIDESEYEVEDEAEAEPEATEESLDEEEADPSTSNLIEEAVEKLEALIEDESEELPADEPLETIELPAAQIDERQEAAARLERKRFTWESPEMWWESEDDSE